MKKSTACICLTALSLMCASCSSKESSKNSVLASVAPTQTAKATTSPKSTGSGETDTSKYNKKIKGTWKNTKSNEVYTFDGDKRFSYKGSEKSTVGKYSFTSDATNTMIVLGLDEDNEIENRYFKLVFEDDHINVVNGKGENETWVKQ